MNFDIKEIELRANQYISSVSIDRKLLDTCKVDVKDHLVSSACYAMIMSLRAEIYGKDHPEQHVVRYPENWWEAVKERFAPAWFLDKYPVRFTVISASLQELYPGFRPATDRFSPVVKFFVKNDTEMPIW